MRIKPMLVKTATPMAKKFKQVVKKKNNATPESRLWEFWLSLPFGVKHKWGNSQVKQRTLRILKQIMAGQLGSDIMPLDQDWLNKQNIRIGVAKRQWPELALRAVLNNMNESFAPDAPQWLLGLSKMPLHVLLYNSHSQRSWFLVFYQQGAITNQEIIERRITAAFTDDMVAALKEITEIVTTANETDTLSPPERSTVRRIARDICAIYEDVPLDRCKVFRREFGTVAKFARAYKEHVYEKALGRANLQAWQLGVRCNLWDDFYTEVVNFCGKREKADLEFVYNKYRERNKAGNV